MNILIVEDNEISSEILNFNLKQQGYQPIVARTGCQALEIMQKVADIRLIITDIMMPEMTGLEFLEKLRQAEAWKKIPVILCTSVSDMDMVRRAAALGCRHYLVKPFQRWMLLQKVAEAMGDAKPVLADAQQVRQKLGLDQAAFAKVLQSFAQTVAEQLKLLDQKLHQAGSPPVAINLISLAEGAHTLGAERLARVCVKLQTQSAQTILVGADYTPLYQELKLVSEALRATVSPAVTASV
jgi:two-component system, chemotaxis family, chemotaxis protein CheY